MQRLYDAFVPAFRGYSLPTRLLPPHVCACTVYPRCDSQLVHGRQTSFSRLHLPHHHLPLGGVESRPALNLACLIDDGTAVRETVA